MRVGTQNFLITLDTVFDYIPVFSTISNLIDAIIRKVVISHKTSSEIESNRYFKHLKTKEADGWVSLIPFVGNGVFIYHRYFEYKDGPKTQPDPNEKLLNAISTNGASVLLNVSEDLRSNKDFMFKAVKRDVACLQYASIDLRTNKEFMLQVVQMNGLALQYNYYRLGEAQKQIEKAAIKQNPDAAKWVPSIDSLLSEDGLLLQYLRPDDKDSYYYVLTAIRQNPLALQYASRRLQTDPVMLRSISFAIEHLSADLRNSVDFMKPLIKQNGLHLQHAGPRVRSDEATAIEAFKQDADAFQYIGDSVKKRVVFLLFTNKISNIKEQQQITAASYVINNQESFSEEVRLKAAEALENTFWDDKSRFRSSNNEYKIEISSALVKKYPENVLKKLYSCFDKHPGAERLRLVQLHDATLERLPEVIDQAGVTRTFLTDLFQSLKEQAESDNYKLLRFENTAGGALPIASLKTKEGSYRSIPPHKVASLTEPKLREAVALAYLTVEDAPDELKNAEGELDLNKVKAKFDRIQRDIDSLSNEEERLYQIIGKLMGLCYSSNKRYLIGQIFDPLLFNVLQAIPTNELHKAYKRLNENTLLHMYHTLNPTEKRFSHLRIVHPQLLTEDLAQEVLLYAYPDEDERPDALKGNPSLETVQRHFPNIQKDIKTNLLEAAKQDATLRAIFAIGRGYAKHNEDEEHWRTLVWSPPAIMLKRIQGLFSPELVKNAIQCSDSTVKNYFIRWIDENSGDINKLQDFLYAVTGSRALAVGSKLKIEENLQSEQHLPQFHTCFRSVDVFRYRTYVIFKEKLETSIKESLASGFQRM